MDIKHEVVIKKEMLENETTEDEASGIFLLDKVEEETQKMDISSFYNRPKRLKDVLNLADESIPKINSQKTGIPWILPPESATGFVVDDFSGHEDELSLISKPGSTLGEKSAIIGSFCGENNIEQTQNNRMEKKRPVDDWKWRNNTAARKGDVQSIQDLLKDFTNANNKDISERTPLHYAVYNGHIDIVNLLLKFGADITRVTNKGYTVLHTAAFKDHKEILEVLLQNISRDKLNDFVNARTTSDNTSLHVAAKNGSFEIVKTLLKHGAIYDYENNEGKTPVDLSKDQKVTNLLKSIEDLFRNIKDGNVEAVSKIRAMKHDEVLVIKNARNNQGNTLLQVALVNQHENIASYLVKILKDSDEVQSQFSPECEFDQLKRIKSDTLMLLSFSRTYLSVLRSMSESYGSEKNVNSSNTLREGSFYLLNVYNFAKKYKNSIPGSIDNKYIQTISDILVALEFDPKHLSSVDCFVSKGQGTKYYNLLYSELKKDVRSFIEMVELNIEIPLKKLLKSVKERLQSAFPERLFEVVEKNSFLASFDECF